MNLALFCSLKCGCAGALSYIDETLRATYLGDFLLAREGIQNVQHRAPDILYRGQWPSGQISKDRVENISLEASIKNHTDRLSSYRTGLMYSPYRKGH